MRNTVIGAQILHDLPGDNPAAAFHLDHLVICTRGTYAVWTKTPTKPSGRARVVV